jgi:hypothetical protein
MGWTLPVAIYFVTDTWLIVVINHLVSKVFFGSTHRRRFLIIADSAGECESQLGAIDALVLGQGRNENYFLATWKERQRAAQGLKESTAMGDWALHQTLRRM